MDMIDILGGLLRKKAGSSGPPGGPPRGAGSGGILKDILTGGRSSSGRAGGTTGAPAQSSGFPRIVEQSGQDEPEFESLDDFLKNAHTGRKSSGEPTGSGKTGSVPATPGPRTQPQYPVPKSNPKPTLRPTAPSLPPSETLQRPSRRPLPGETDVTSIDPNARAELLVKAMINAAKADGQIDQAEQDMIVKQLGTLTQHEIQFLQSEFAAPLNVSEFVRSVPIGMEQEIYAISLMAMNLNNNAEAMYLKELAHGFRMTLAGCNQIHQKYGAPPMK